MTDTTYVLKRAPTMVEISAAQGLIMANDRLGLETEPRIYAAAAWPIEKAADFDTW